MSWQKCVTAEFYPLAVPALVVVALHIAHLVVWVVSVSVELPSDLIALVWLVAFRSWRQMQSKMRSTAQRVLSFDHQGRLNIHEHSRTDCGRERNVPFRGSRAGCAQSAAANADESVLKPDHSEPGSDFDVGQNYYTCCRSVRAPGCVALSLVSHHGKPLEILVFYRYDQRQFYARIVRHLAYC